MLSKNRNLLLLAILIVVVAIYWWSQRSAGKMSNYRTTLTEVDTAAVDQINIAPPDGAEAFTLTKTDAGWKIQGAGKTYTADPNTMKRTLGMLNAIPVKRIASQNATSHEEFAVTADKGTHVEMFSDGQLVDDLILGKFDYIQPQNAQPDPRGRQPQGEMIFYAVITGEPTVYVIDGQIGFGLGKDMDAFRNKTLINLDKSQIQRVTMENTGESSHVMQLNDGKWQYDNQPIDSTKAAQFIAGLSRKNGSKFTDVNPEAYPLAQVLTITGDGMEEVVIKAYQQDSVNMLVTSTQNTEAVFVDKNGTQMKQLFKDKDFFEKKKK